MMNTDQATRMYGIIKHVSEGHDFGFVTNVMHVDGDTFLVVPFAGSGSECVAANKLKVKFIGYEINPDYVDLCNDRLNININII